MATYLDEIMAWHRARADADARDWRERLEEREERTPRFADALRAGGELSVIAEIKRRSPSKGPLDEGLDAGALAALYEGAGARAISVLTDEVFFAGSASDLRRARERASIPILRKDFTISANDVIDAAEWGADAVLLIVAALNDGEIHALTTVAERCGLDALVEVHDETEAARAVDLGARVIGVNQRDLKTFEVDPARAARVAGLLPEGVVRVCESGLRAVEDLVAASAAGFDAVLIGETLVTSPDRATTLGSFTNIARRSDRVRER